MSKTPRLSDNYRHIFLLDMDEDGEPWGEVDGDVLWCQDDIDGTGRKYIREDVVNKQLAAAEKLLQEIADSGILFKHDARLDSAVCNYLITAKEGPKPQPPTSDLERPSAHR